MQNKFLISKTDDAIDLELPQYMTDGASGMDLHANITDTLTIKKGERELVSVGIKISIPQGYEAQVRPRSGLSNKFGVTILNSPGTIDSDYRGEIKVILINLGKDDFIIERGERIAQLVIQKVEIIDFIQTEQLDETQRGEGAFGHTGTQAVSLFVGIDNYNNKMHISNVVKYFERRGITLTNTMLSNYVRVKVLPPLEKKRYYTKKHLVFIVLIDHLKEIYSLDALRVIFTPLFDLENEDDYINILNYFNNFYSNTIELEKATLLENINSITNFDTENQYIAVLLTMAKSLANKKIVDEFINGK